MSQGCAVNAARHKQRVLGCVPSGFWACVLQSLAFTLLDLCLWDGLVLCQCWECAFTAQLLLVLCF